MHAEVKHGVINLDVVASSVRRSSLGHILRRVDLKSRQRTPDPMSGDLASLRYRQHVCEIDGLLSTNPHHLGQETGATWW